VRNSPKGSVSLREMTLPPMENTFSGLQRARGWRVRYIPLDLEHPRDFILYNYSAAKTKSFYSNFLLEYVWNKPGHHKDEVCNPDGPLVNHPQSKYLIHPQQKAATWDHIIISYGPSEDNIKGRASHYLCTNWTRLMNQVEGDTAEVCYLSSSRRELLITN
jgi:hypothetical protein